jgi:hypothetical protein
VTPRRRTLRRLLGACAALLVVIGVTNAIARAIHAPDLISRIDRGREKVYERIGIVDPFIAERAAAVARADSRFAAHPTLIRIHVIAGGLFLLAVPLQFSARLRSSRPGVHRWSGRIQLGTALGFVVTGLFFGILMPFAGWGEALLIALVGVGFAACLAKAWIAIRRRQVAVHREWMIRVFALAIAVAVVRVVGGIADPILTPAGWRPAEVFVLSLWVGWLATLAAAEGWIRYTRTGAAERGASTP